MVEVLLISKGIIGVDLKDIYVEEIWLLEI